MGCRAHPWGCKRRIRRFADFLKPLGYATAQFGKNHLGDQDRFLPTAHGFDEFFGNLYHLNAEEEPENEDYPKDPEFRKKFGPRGVLRATAEWKIADTGPLTRKRMETVDEEFMAAAKDFITRQVKSAKPFFTWFNSTRMHVFTHLKPASVGKSGAGLQGDGMLEHDAQVGELLKLLDDLKVADNTIVIYTTDNGAMKNQWPDGGSSPFRSEKDTNWEGAYRVPALIRWPGKIKAGKQLHGALLRGRLATHARRRCRRKPDRPRGFGEGSDARLEDVQGPHRRLQPAALSDGADDEERAPGVRATSATTAIWSPTATIASRPCFWRRPRPACRSGVSPSRRCARRC